MYSSLLFPQLNSLTKQLRTKNMEQAQNTQ